VTLRPRLRAALTAAMKSRDAAAVAALRSALAAIDNAEAVDPAQGPVPPPAGGPVAKSVAGVGAAEVPRRELTAEEEAAIVAGEAAERRAAATEYERLGRTEDAARLRSEADLLDTFLEAP